MHICLTNASPLLAHVMVEYLKNNGHTVDTVKGLDLPPKTPELLIVDIIPSPSNLKQLQNIHQHHPHVPIVLVYDMPTRLQFSEARQCGIQAYLRKPFSLFELDMAIWQVKKKEPHRPIKGS